MGEANRDETKAREIVAEQDALLERVRKTDPEAAARYEARLKAAAAVDPTMARDVSSRVARARKSHLRGKQLRGLAICNGGGKR